MEQVLNLVLIEGAELLTAALPTTRQSPLDGQQGHCPVLAVEDDKARLRLVPPQFAKVRPVELSVGADETVHPEGVGGPFLLPLRIVMLDRGRGPQRREGGRPLVLKRQEHGHDRRKERRTGGLLLEQIRDEVDSHPVIVQVPLKQLVEVEISRVHDLPNRDQALGELSLGRVGVSSEPGLGHDVVDPAGRSVKAAPGALHVVTESDLGACAIHPYVASLKTVVPRQAAGEGAHGAARRSGNWALARTSAAGGARERRCG
ncbi:hypothetical protein, partial [Streptomyces lividans]|uniref:hypothetical protein n=1 Tax=Streptomyces lividans TaxID=1916 RepID=UPI003265ED4B